MTENPFAHAFEKPAEHNQPVLSVSELSGALKRTVEDAFALVRVRGEISGFKRAASGHLYLALKDENAVMDAICWKGVASKLDIKPQDGMEVICKGRLTTYPGRSKYQMVIESMELAGEGALLKLLEDLKRKLQAEGLFDPARKKPIPFLPTVIGIVTSPTGAVIRDIMHRLNDRFPRHVLLWPCLVQGKGAAEQVAAAIKGFNGIKAGGPVPRPDLIIVARGGGSLEDLWSFNEEIVVRAAAQSDIPLISAVGHETDTTLIDYASDKRAPTPTAAAEMAVPVRREILAQVMDDGTRLVSAMNRMLDERQIRVLSASRAIPNPERVVEDLMQRLDDRVERMDNAVQTLFQRHDMNIKRLAASIPHPVQHLNNAQDRLHARTQALRGAYKNFVQQAQGKYERSAALVRERAARDAIERGEARLKRLDDLLESYSYKSVLERGFALVTDQNGAAVMRAADVSVGQALNVHFAGDDILPVAVLGDDINVQIAPAAPVDLPCAPEPEPVHAPEAVEALPAPVEEVAPAPVKPKRTRKKKTSSPPEQGSLF